MDIRLFFLGSFSNTISTQISGLVLTQFLIFSSFLLHVVCPLSILPFYFIFKDKGVTRGRVGDACSGGYQ